MQGLNDNVVVLRVVGFTLGLLMLLAVLVLMPTSSCQADTQSLRIVDSSRDPLTLHPHRSIDPNSDLVISQIYEGLIDYDEQGRLVGRLAVKWRRLSPLRYRFWLREGVYFHNGEPFDAEAVRFSLSIQMSDRPRPAANSWLFDPDFHAEIIDRYIVDLVTGRPDARLPYTLPTFFKIVPPQFVRASGSASLSQHPVGTGPYRFVSWERGHAINLIANSRYWKPGHPHIQKLSFLFVDQDRQVESLLKGDIDLITKLAGKDTLKLMQEPGTKVLKRHVASVFWAAMKNFDSPFADKKVRQAMNYAINKRHLNQYVEKGNSIQVSTMTNPLEMDYHPNLRPYPFDPSIAKRLLTDAGYPYGFNVRVLASEDTKYMADALKAQLQMIGVYLDIKILPREEYLRLTIIPKMETGKPAFDGDMVIWLTPNPTLNAFFNPAVIFYSKSPYAIMNDAKFDRLYFDFIHQSEKEAIRRSLYRLQAYMLDQAFSIYTAQRVLTIGLRKGLNLQLDPTGTLFGFTLMKAYWQDTTVLGTALETNFGLSSVDEDRSRMTP